MTNKHAVAARAWRNKAGQLISRLVGKTLQVGYFDQLAGGQKCVPALEIRNCRPIYSGWGTRLEESRLPDIPRLQTMTDKSEYQQASIDLPTPSLPR